MGGKEVGERVMGCKIREMEMGKGGWEIRNWGKGRKERERERGKEQRATGKEQRARDKGQGNRARGKRQSTRGKE